MDALRGSRGHDKIPRRLEDPRGTESLPEGDIEFPPGRPAPRQPCHDHLLSHPSHYQSNGEANHRSGASVIEDADVVRGDCHVA